MMLYWTQLVSHPDAPIFRDGAIVLVAVLRGGGGMDSSNSWKPMELAMITHTNDSHDMKVPFVEASQGVICNVLTNLGWLIMNASPEVDEHALLHVNPKQH